MTSTDIFNALANPVRRQILELLLEEPKTVNDLVDQFDLRRPAISEHLQVLRLANLVRDERCGRERRYHLEAARLAEVQEWLKPFGRYWVTRMDQLSQFLDEETE